MLLKSMITTAMLLATCQFAAAGDCASRLDTKAKAFVGDLVTCLRSLEQENITLKKQVEQLSFPVGAVIAFDDPAGCSKMGESWADANFGGKVIVGALGSGRWGYRKEGGRTSVTIDASNLPPLYLGYDNANHGTSGTIRDVKSLSFTKPSTGSYQTSSQPAAEIDIMPPYVPIHLCKRIK